VTGALFAAAILSLLGSCGGGEDEQPLTKDQFIEQGNAICQRGLREKDEVVSEGLKNLSDENSGPPSRQDLERLVDATLPVFEDMTEQLAELSGPPKDQAITNRMVEQFEAGLQVLEEDPQAVIDSNPFEEAGATARSYGLTACTF
jgi:hypothetical protein